MDLPRIIAVDLDGTLLRTDGTVSERTRQVLRQAQDRGAALVAVTARPPRVLDHVVRQVALTGTAICSNGAITYDLASGAVTITHQLAPSMAADAVERLRAVLPQATFAVETGYRVLHEPAFPHRSRFDYRFFVCPDIAGLWTEAESIVKLLVKTDDLVADDAMALARPVLDGTLEVTHSGGSGLLEITASGVTKALGLAAYCAGRGVTASQVIAFGDGHNDLPMLHWAGTGYAVANAHPEVLAQTTHHTSSNDADGVAEVIEQLFSGTGR